MHILCVCIYIYVMNIHKHTHYANQIVNFGCAQSRLIVYSTSLWLAYRLLLYSMQKAKELIGSSKAKTGASKNLLGEIFCLMKQTGCYQMISSRYFVRQVCVLFMICPVTQPVHAWMHCFGSTLTLLIILKCIIDPNAFFGVISVSHRIL